MVYDIINIYSYNKKSHELYLVTKYANCVVIVDDQAAKILKKNKTIPYLKDDELKLAISSSNANLDEIFRKKNNDRRQQIEDSIATAVAKARADSIVRARVDSIRRAEILQKRENYRKAHLWNWVPLKGERMNCALCDYTVSYEDSIFCIALHNDSLYSIDYKYFALDESYLQVHRFAVPASLKTNERFKYHINVYADSLNINDQNRSFVENTELMNAISLYGTMDKVEKKAPYGYFDNWEWGSDYGNVSFDFRYTNTNKKTIKYIDVYWKITNSVNDLRKNGHFKGTGPLEQWQSATWEWDYSPYFVAGDASSMIITKVIITYMNGSQKVLTGSQLWFD